MLPKECEQSWDSRSASRFFFVPQALVACHRLYDAFGKLDIDCYKSGDDGAGKCSTENVKQGVRKGQHDFDATRENQKKNNTTRKDGKLTHRHGQQKRHTPCGTKTTKRTIFLWRQLSRRDGRFPKFKVLDSQSYRTNAKKVSK